MLITVYADILFLINFSMDFLTLCLAGRLTAKKLSRRRLLLSAGLGGFCGTAAMFLLKSEGVPFVLCGLCLALAMTRIAFGKYGKAARLVRDSVILWGTGTLLGGIMTSVLSFGEVRGNSVFTGDGGDRFLPVFLLCFGISSVLVRLTKSSSAKSSAEITVSADGVTVTFTALADSGCLLTEPISGTPVIVASAKALGQLAVRLSADLSADDTSLRLRMIPADGVCGHRLLRGFIPEKVTVCGNEVSAVIACDPTGTDYGGFAGIVPMKLTR